MGRMSKWEDHGNVKLLLCKDGYSHAEVTIYRTSFATYFICDAYNSRKTFKLSFLTPSFIFQNSKKRKEELLVKKSKDWCENTLRTKAVWLDYEREN